MTSLVLNLCAVYVGTCCLLAYCIMLSSLVSCTVRALVLNYIELCCLTMEKESETEQIFIDGTVLAVVCAC